MERTITLQNLLVKLGYETAKNATFKEVLKAGKEKLIELIESGDIKISNTDNHITCNIKNYTLPTKDYLINTTKVLDKKDYGYLTLGNTSKQSTVDSYLPNSKEVISNISQPNTLAKDYHPYVIPTYIFTQSKQPDSVIDILRKQNKISFRINDFVLEHPRTNKSGIDDDNWKVECALFKEAIQLTKNETIYFGHQYDKRGRIYNDGYLLNYQGDEWQKATLSPIIPKQKLTDRGMRAMRIDLANHYGLDKLNYDERLSANLDNLIAKKPLLAHLSKIALSKATKTNETDYVCAIDATASGMQILSILANCEHTAKLTNLTDLSKCYDIYGEACKEIIAKTGVTNIAVKDIRDIVKKALMTRGYNSDKQVKVAQVELKRFGIHLSVTELTQILDLSPKITKCKDAMNNLLCDTFSQLPDDKQIIRYTMPDGFIVEFPNIVKKMQRVYSKHFKCYIKYDQLGWNKELNWRALSPNLIHSEPIIYAVLKLG